jgi:predicted phosphodiesterase
MRMAIISDVHGNLTALDAVLADLRRQRPDVVFHGAICLTEDRIPPK